VSILVNYEKKILASKSMLTKKCYVADRSGPVFLVLELSFGSIADLLDQKRLIHKI
jgi:hypothetical protein